MIAKPKDAATLILLRSARRFEPGIEVLVLRRNTSSAFLPGAYVFPGGMVEVADYAPEVERICHGLSFEKARGIIDGDSPPERALGFFVAAIRETFEEAGILLVCRESSALAALDEGQEARFARYRKKVHDYPVALMPIFAMAEILGPDDQKQHL